MGEISHTSLRPGSPPVPPEGVLAILDVFRAACADATSAVPGADFVTFVVKKLVAIEPP